MFHSRCIKIAFAVVLAPVFPAMAQEITVSTTFQTLNLSTVQAFASDGDCSRNLQITPASELDAGDSWMQCSSFSAALPAGTGLTLHASSSHALVSGNYSFLNTDAANGPLDISYAEIGAASISCDNSACSLVSTAVHGGAISSVNEPLSLNNVVLGANIDLTNSALLAQKVKVPQGRHLRMTGTNSDFHLKGLSCAPAGAGVSTPSYRTIVKTKLNRGVNRLKGRIDLYRVIRLGKMKKEVRCASIGVNLIIGRFNGK